MHALPRTASALIVIGAIAMTFARTAAAVPINYGDFMGDNVTFMNVTEDSTTDPVPLFGAPNIANDNLDFDPIGFAASGTGGDLDITDGQLNFDLTVAEMDNEVVGGIQSLLVTNAGDFTLFGTGTAATSVAAGVSVRVDILEVDGFAIDPIDVFASNSIVRDLVSDGPVVLAPWDNGVLIEFAPILISNNIEFAFGVTRAQIVIDDQLLATSEPGSIAFIAKKDLDIELGLITASPSLVRGDESSAIHMPEPTSAALLALAGLVGVSRRRRLAA